MHHKVTGLIGKTWCLGLCTMLAVSVGCGQRTNKLDAPAPPAAEAHVSVPLSPTQPRQDLSALEAYIDSRGGLLPATYTVRDIFVSHLVSKFNDNTFDFDLAQAANKRFAIDAFSLSRKVGGSYDEIFATELKLWESYGFLKCEACIKHNNQPRAVLASDGRPALEISVGVILTDVTDAVPSLRDSPFSRTLGYLMRSTHTAEKPLIYNATIVALQDGDRFLVGSHGAEGQELAPEALQSIIRRNVMTLLSARLMGLTKKAGAMVLLPEGEGITLDRLRDFDADRKHADETLERERIQAEELRAADQVRRSHEAALKNLVDAIPSRAAGVRVHVAFTQHVRDQLRHNALDIELFDAVAHLWEIRAAAARSRPGYSATQLAKDAAAMIHEFGVATVTCDLEIQKPSFSHLTDHVRIPVTYHVVSIDAQRPRPEASWVAAATWGALPKQGTVTVDFPIETKDTTTWRIGYWLPAGALLGRDAPATAWGQPADVLSPQSVLNAANRAVAESLAVGSERAAQEAIDLSPAERIQKSSLLFGGIECLPEAAPKEDGIDLAVLAMIAEEVNSGVFWEKRLPGVATADRDSAAAVLKRLYAVLKPKKWTSKLNERIVARPVFLSDTHVLFDLGGGQRGIDVPRDACNDEGSKLLDRIEQIAVDCVVKLNDAARSRDGVPPEKAEAAWQAVSKAVRGLVSGNGSESREAVVSLAAAYASLGSDSAAEQVRSDIARCAAAVLQLFPDHGRGNENSRLLQPFLAHKPYARGIQPGMVAQMQMILAIGDRNRCRELAEKAVEVDPGPNQLCDYGRVAWALGLSLMADGETAQSLEWLRKANDAFAESRGKAALQPAELLQALGATLVATGQSQEGAQVLKQSRRVLLLTHGEDDGRVKQFDSAHPASELEHAQ